MGLLSWAAFLGDTRCTTWCVHCSPEKTAQNDYYYKCSLETLTITKDKT